MQSALVKVSGLVKCDGTCTSWRFLLSDYHLRLLWIGWTQTQATGQVGKVSEQVYSQTQGRMVQIQEIGLVCHQNVP